MKNILGNEALTIQTFDDDKQRHERKLARILQYPKDKTEIESTTEQGAGAFMCLNPQENITLRSIENTKALRFLTTDWDVCKEEDNLSKEEITNRKQQQFEKFKNFPLQPNHVNETKNGYQCVWELAKEIPLLTVEERIKANIEYQNIIRGIDTSVGLHSEGDNICRVIRMPGTLHRKNPNDTFLITSVNLNTKKVTKEEFCKIYPPVEKQTNTPKPQTTYKNDNSVLGKIINYPVQSALEKLSGTEAVDYEQFTFKENSNGTVQIIIDGQISGQWIDLTQNTIGGSGAGKGNPTILQFVQWYGINRRGENEKTAKGKAIRALKNILGIVTYENTYQPTGALQSNRNNPAMQWSEPLPITDLTDENDPIEWLWKGFIALGHITLLAALMKCGKTTLICLFLKALQQSLQFLNQEIKKVNVLIISEEPKARWNERRRKYGLQFGIWLSSKPTFGKMSMEEWSNYIGFINTFCLENDIKLVIIDTLTTFSPVKDENNSSEVTESLLPFNKLLEKNIALLLIHHLRKAGGEEAIASRGSTALASAVDIIVEFRRLSATVGETQRVLRCYSRDEETPEELVINLDKTTNEYEVLGTRQEVIQKAKANILLALIPIEPEGITTEEIRANWPEEKIPNKTTIFRRLKKFESEGWVKVIGKREEEKGKPDLWARTIALQNTPLTDAMDFEEKIEGYENNNNIQSVIEYVDAPDLSNSSLQENNIYFFVKQLRDESDKHANYFPLKSRHDYEPNEFETYLGVIKDYELDTNPNEPNQEIYQALAKEYEEEINKNQKGGHDV